MGLFESKAQMVTVATEETDASDDCNDDALALFRLYTAQGKKDGIFVILELSGKPVKIHVNTGASVCLVPWSIYLEHLKNCSLQPVIIHLSTYTGDTIPAFGKILVPVTYEGNE